MKVKSKNLSTIAIHAGTEKNAHGTLATPIYQTSTYIFDNAEQGGRRFALEEEGYIYTRLGNPTHTVLEQKVAALEGAEAAAVMSSGMGATTSLFWTVLQAGDHVLSDDTIYGCTHAYIEHGLSKFGIEYTFTDMSDLENVKKHIKPNTKIVFFETPANPNLKVIDIAEVAKIAKANRKDTLVVTDNTFATPIMTRPLELGADAVMHSATKYLNGHGDVIAGFIVGSKELITQVKLVGIKDMTGAVTSPFDAFLMIRGLKTLDIRVKKHCENAMEVAKFLDSHPKVEKVYYPGLPSHKGHAIAKKQMKHFGAVIAFEVKGGMSAGKKVCNSVEMCTLAVSLGDAETLIQHPASMTHSPYSPEARAEAGITDGMIRLSVGLEDAQDIINDLNNALSKI